MGHHESAVVNVLSRKKNCARVAAVPGQWRNALRGGRGGLNRMTLGAVRKIGAGERYDRRIAGCPRREGASPDGRIPVLRECLTAAASCILRKNWLPADEFTIVLQNEDPRRRRGGVLTSLGRESAPSSIRRNLSVRSPVEKDPIRRKVVLRREEIRARCGHLQQIRWLRLQSDCPDRLPGLALRMMVNCTIGSESRERSRRSRAAQIEDAAPRLRGRTRTAVEGQRSQRAGTAAGTLVGRTRCRTPPAGARAPTTPPAEKRGAAQQPSA